MCWLMHKPNRKILIRGTLPMGIDDVVFCERCDRKPGRLVRVFQPALGWH